MLESEEAETPVEPTPANGKGKGDNAASAESEDAKLLRALRRLVLRVEEKQNPETFRQSLRDLLGSFEVGHSGEKLGRAARKAKAKETAAKVQPDKGKGKGGGKAAAGKSGKGKQDSAPKGGGQSEASPWVTVARAKPKVRQSRTLEVEVEGEFRPVKLKLERLAGRKDRSLTTTEVKIPKRERQASATDEGSKAAAGPPKGGTADATMQDAESEGKSKPAARTRSRSPKKAEPKTAQTFPEWFEILECGGQGSCCYNAFGAGYVFFNALHKEKFPWSSVRKEVWSRGRTVEQSLHPISRSAVPPLRGASAPSLRTVSMKKVEPRGDGLKMARLLFPGMTTSKHWPGHADTWMSSALGHAAGGSIVALSFSWRMLASHRRSLSMGVQVAVPMFTCFS